MKNIRFLFIIGVLISAVMFSSCGSNSYAKKRKKEKADLANYIKNRNIQVKEGVNDSIYLDEFEGEWPENTFYKTYRGAYVRITKRNAKGKRAENGNTCVIRFISYNLDGQEVSNNLDTKKSREGIYFVYTKGGTTPCVGWNDAIPFLRHDAECEMIIESTIGPEEQQTEVIPLRIVVASFTVSNNN